MSQDGTNWSEVVLDELAIRAQIELFIGNRNDSLLLTVNLLRWEQFEVSEGSRKVVMTIAKFVMGVLVVYC
jgi:hypothetical protein